MPAVCTEDDEYVRDRLRWVVDLDNGQRIYGDDDRPGVEPASAWKRLRAYCYENGICITHMYFQFRSHIVEAAQPFAPGYFFSRMAACFSGDGETYHGYVGGHLLGDNRVQVTRWWTPSLVPIDTEIRVLDSTQVEHVLDNRLAAVYNSSGQSPPDITIGGPHASEEPKAEEEGLPDLSGR